MTSHPAPQRCRVADAKMSGSIMAFFGQPYINQFDAINC